MPGGPAKTDSMTASGAYRSARPSASPVWLSPHVWWCQRWARTAPPLRRCHKGSADLALGYSEAVPVEVGALVEAPIAAQNS
jgi:hypothetical protein